MNYFLGIDTGATKSHALIADENGRVVGFGSTGPGNWEVIGWEGTRAVLDEIITQALDSAGIAKSQLAGAGFGLAGYDWPEDRQPHVDIIHSLDITAPFEIVNDAMLGLLAGSDTGWGVGIGAGTSCNCYGRDQSGKIGRVTGSSEWFGEYAGASELVRAAIRAIARAWSLRGPQTALTEALIAEAGAKDATDLFAGLMRDRYHLGSHNAKTVFAVAEAGDTVAQGLIQWAGEELGGLAQGIIRQLDIAEERFPVVLAGSFFKGGPAPHDTP